MKGTSRKLANFKDFTRFILTLLDLLFPPKCISCGTQTGPFQDPCLCSVCWENLFSPLVFHIPSLGEDEAIGWAASSYEKTLQKMVQKAKFGANPSALQILAKGLCNLFQTFLLTEKFDLVTWVPGVPQRIRKRGIDLPGYLTWKLSQKFKFFLEPNLLLRQKMVPEQTSLSYEERKKNVQGGFSLSQDVFGMHILLVDDVFTTGATAFECSNLLLNAGAKKITFLVVSKTPLHFEKKDKGFPS